jgi:hypothetical protein
MSLSGDGPTNGLAIDMIVRRQKQANRDVADCAAKYINIM